MCSETHSDGPECVISSGPWPKRLHDIPLTLSGFLKLLLLGFRCCFLSTRWPLTFTPSTWGQLFRLVLHLIPCVPLRNIILLCPHHSPNPASNVQFSDVRTCYKSKEQWELRFFSLSVFNSWRHSSLESTGFHKIWPLYSIYCLLSHWSFSTVYHWPVALKKTIHLK